MTTATVQSDVDIFSEETMRDPYAIYASLRDTGPAVYLSRYDVYAVARYAEARHVLGNWEDFSSADIALNEQFNGYVGEGILRADPPLHDHLRGVLASRLAPRAIRALRHDIDERAANLVDSLLDRATFDGVTDLAQAFPVQIVGDLIGLPAKGREPLLELIDANFNCFGPLNDRTMASFPKLQKLAEYVAASASRDALSEGSMGQAVYDAVDAGHVPEEAAPWLVMTYVTAGMDTTVHALGHLLWLLGTHPDQWAVLRDDSSLVPSAVREVLRYESPVQLFGRTVRSGWSIDGLDLPAGSRLAVLYGSANRDERKWENPDRFDVTRDNIEHLAFGYGLHGCGGQALATLEGEALLRALLARVERFSVGEPVRHFNNVLRGLESLPVTVVRG